MGNTSADTFKVPRPALTVKESIASLVPKVSASIFERRALGIDLARID